MSNTNTSNQSTVYQIRLKGHLSGEWTDWFGGLTITAARGETLLTGPVADQAALHGLLRKVRDVGLPLISVMRLDSDSTGETNLDQKKERES